MAKKMVEISKTELTKMRKKIESENRKKEKRNERRFDGFGNFLKARTRMVLRELWLRSSESRKLAVKRCALPGGYSKCEQCKSKVPKIYIDHIKRVGDLDSGFLHRLFCDSSGLQGLCHDCHKKKTNEERASQREALKNF